MPLHLRLPHTAAGWEKWKMASGGWSREWVGKWKYGVGGEVTQWHLCLHNYEITLPQSSGEILVCALPQSGLLSGQDLARSYFLWLCFLHFLCLLSAVLCIIFHASALRDSRLQHNDQEACPGTSNWIVQFYKKTKNRN